MTDTPASLNDCPEHGPFRGTNCTYCDYPPLRDASIEMTQKAIIGGIEKFCIDHLNRNDPELFTLGSTMDGGFEIILGGRVSKRKERRFAYCKHESDAQLILAALWHALKSGVI